MKQIEQGAVDASGRARSFINTATLKHKLKGSSGQIVDIVDSLIGESVEMVRAAINEQLMGHVMETLDTLDGLGGWGHKMTPEMIANSFSLEEIQGQLQSIGIPKSAFQGVDPLSLLRIFRPKYFADKNEFIVQHRNADGVHLYKMNPSLYRALQGISPVQLLSPFVKMLVLPWQRLLRLGATGIAPAFAIANTYQDATTGTIQSANGIHPISMANALIREALPDNPWVSKDPREQFIELFGIEFNQGLKLDPESMRSTADSSFGKSAIVAAMSGRLIDAYDAASKRAGNMVRKFNNGMLNGMWGLWEGARDTVIGGADLAQKVISFSEIGPRRAEMMAVYDRHGFTEDKIRAGAVIPMDVHIEAANAAAAVTINFGRRGWAIGAWNDYAMPYSNAAVQATDAMVRQLLDPERRM
jgi:hypothetical protein